MDRGTTRSPLGISLYLQTSTQETPYDLTYETKTMISVEVGEPTIRRQLFDLTLNQKSLSVGLDLINKFRDKSKIWEAACKLRATRHYNTKVWPMSFQKGDLVWQMRSEAKRKKSKFSSNWEGPF